MNLLKTAATISGLTLLSRITGLARETLTAAYFGAGSQTDAFFVAFRLPNLLRRLFAEGAFSQAFVPVLGQIKAQEGEAAALGLPETLRSSWPPRWPQYAWPPSLGRQSWSGSCREASQVIARLLTSQ